MQGICGWYIDLKKFLPYSSRQLPISSDVCRILRKLQRMNLIALYYMHAIYDSTCGCAQYEISVIDSE